MDILKIFRKKSTHLKIKNKLLKLSKKDNAFSKAEAYVNACCTLEPKKAIGYKKILFSVYKDIELEATLRIGDEIVGEVNDASFTKVLAVRHKRAGNIERHNALLGIKEELSAKKSSRTINNTNKNKSSNSLKFDIKNIEQRIKELLKLKRTYDSIDRYIQLKINEFPQKEIQIKKLAFSLLKDIYTKDVMHYAEDVLKVQKDKKFLKVVENRYIYLNKNNLSQNQAFDNKEFKKLLLEVIENNNQRNDIINLHVKKFPQAIHTIYKTAFSLLKDKYIEDAIFYGEEVIKNEKNIDFIAIFLTRLKKLKDEEKIYKYSKMAYSISKESKYLNEIITYEHKTEIDLMRQELKNNEERLFLSRIKKMIHQYYDNREIIYKIAADIYSDYDIKKSILSIERAIKINKSDALYLILFSLYIKKGDLTKAVESMPRNSSNKTLIKKVSIWKKNIKLLDEGFYFPETSHSQYDNKQNKILYLLHNTLPYHSGGYATRAHGLMHGVNSFGNYMMEGVSRLGYPKDILKLSNDEDILIKEEIEGIVYHRLKSDITRGSTTYFEYIKEYAEAVIRLAKEEKPFVIHAASNLYNGLACVYAAKKLGIKSIYEIRGLWEITRISREPEWINTEMYKFNADMETAAALNADVVITITEALKEEMVSRGVPENKIQVIPNGVVSSRFKPLIKDIDLAKKLNINNEVVIGFIGSFVQYEGLNYLVDAVNLLVIKKITNLKVLMVGDGAVWEDVKEYVQKLGLSNYFIFTGRVPHEEVEKYYSLVDIAPFPRKGLPVCEMVSPLKPFEAMAMEKAVVSSNVSALAEIVKDGYNGLLFEKDNITDFAKKLEILIKNRKIRKKLGKQARQWVVEKRDWKTISKNLHSIYEELS